MELDQATEFLELEKTPEYIAESESYMRRVAALQT